MYEAIIPILFKKTQDTDELLKKHRETDSGADDPFRRIRCPLCAWCPERSSRWYCSSNLQPENFMNGCGTSWNTFESRGRCPGCGHQWKWTTCHRCHRWSLHEDWYE